MTNQEFIESISLEGEIWKDVIGYEGLYMVSSFGRIISLGRIVQNPAGGPYWIETKLLNPYINKYGYYSINLRKDNKATTMRIHRIMCKTFLPNPNNLPSIDHIDGNKQNNLLSNLKWCSCKENSNNPNTKRRMSISAKIRCSEGRIHHQEIVGVNIYNPKDIICFDRIMDASKYGFCAPSITKCCKGRLNKHQNYRWYYKSDYEALNKSKNESPDAES